MSKTVGKVCEVEVLTSEAGVELCVDSTDHKAHIFTSLDTRTRVERLIGLLNQALGRFEPGEKLVLPKRP